MPTAIRHIELADGISDIHLEEKYSRFMAFITYHGVPLGDMIIKVRRHTIDSSYLAREIANHFPYDTLRLWLQDQMKYRRSRIETNHLSIDVIVCTCDRPDDLKRCLQSLAETSYPQKSIIVVDNGSESEKTLEVVQEYGARYVREKKKGLDFARNAGLKFADAEIVAYTDDDVVVDGMWLQSIAKVFQDDEAIACVTGLIMPLELETEAQELFEKYFEGGMRRGYERRVFSRFNLPPAAGGKVGSGANMAFRSSVLRRVGGFDEALDCGTPAKAGGDTDMYYRLLRHGYKICYEPSALAWHRHRREMSELQNQLNGYSIAVYAFLTKCAVEYTDWEAVGIGCLWFRNHHLKQIARQIRCKAIMPWSLTWAEIAGVPRGPAAYFKAKSYVSDIRLQCDEERRHPQNRNGGKHTRNIMAILRRAAGGVKRRHA